MSINKQSNFKYNFSDFIYNKSSYCYILKWLILSFIISIFIGSASAGFLISLEWVTDYRESHTWIIVFLPLIGLLISWLYLKYGKSADQGNNLLLDTIHQGGDKIPFRMAPLIYVGTIFTHLFGGSAGREGTALQMAGAIADQFSKPFKLSKEERSTLLISAVAGGFAAVFGTPLAGAVFGMEFLRRGKIKYSVIFPTLLTAILSDQVTKLWNASHTHYNIDIVPELSFQVLLYALIAGIFFAVCAAGFSKSMYWTASLWKTKIQYAPYHAFLAGILVIGTVYLLGTTKYIGLGIPTIIAAFDNQLPAYDFIIKFVLTIVTLSAGFKGGEVTPLFFIGATLGNALSIFIPLPMGLLAGMGFVGVFAGATNTPVACTIMAIELFGPECTIYVAIACGTSYLLSGKTSIYKSQIRV